MEKEYFLKLCDNPIRFSPLNKTTRVFYDQSNQQIFSVHSSSEIGIIVQNIVTKDTTEFRIKNSGPIVSVKLSLDQKIIALQRTKTVVEFYNFQQSVSCILLINEYEKNCKRNSLILGFIWTGPTEILFITNNGLELYKVYPSKRSFLLLKMYNHACDWFLWCPKSSIMILASAHGVNLVPILVKATSFSKLSKLDVEQTRIIVERDITLTQVYDKATILVLKHQVRKYDQVIIFMINDSGDCFIKQHVLNLNYSGKFGINVVDNLMVVHHQRERKSLLFDINLESSCDEFVKYHEYFVDAKEIQPFELEIPCLEIPSKQSCELYTAYWVIIQPDVIMDMKLGCLWNLELNLSQICKNITDLRIAVQLCLSRVDGKAVIFQEILRYFQQTGLKLDVLQSVFDNINVFYRQWLDNNLKSQLALPINGKKTEKLKNPIIAINQTDIFQEVIEKCPFDIKDSVIIEYIRSLLKYGIPVDFRISDELIRILVIKKKIINLLQLIQYRVLKDSVQLARTLLAYGETLPKINQLAIDMFVRLNAIQELEDYLLSNGQILFALKLVNFDSNERSFEKYLQIAKNLNNISVYRSVLNFFKTHPKFQDKVDKIEKFSLNLFNNETEEHSDTYVTTDDSLNLIELFE